MIIDPPESVSFIFWIDLDAIALVKKPDSSISVLSDKRINSFYMAETEVTFDQYDAYCDDQGINKPGDESWGRGSHPVINVSWYDAVKYCNWLSEQAGLPKATGCRRKLSGGTRCGGESSPGDMRMPGVTMLAKLGGILEIPEGKPNRLRARRPMSWGCMT